MTESEDPVYIILHTALTLMLFYIGYGKSVTKLLMFPCYVLIVLFAVFSTTLPIHFGRIANSAFAILVLLVVWIADRRKK